jgi:hypothetical protein
MLDSHLPPEISDHIVDLLRDEPETLKRCCLVSKSWVPRTRKHLFGKVECLSPTRLEAWKKTFPGPTNSPAHHTRYLNICYIPWNIVVDVREPGWIRAFCNVVRLSLWMSTELAFSASSMTSHRFPNLFPCSLHNPFILTNLHTYLFPAPSRGPENDGLRGRRRRRS